MSAAISFSDERSDEQIVLDAYARAVGEGRAPDAGVLAALDRLFAAHQLRVYHVCQRIVGDPERARELAQDTLLTAYQKLPEFRGECAFGTWLFGIARYLCFNAVRRRGEVLIEDEVLAATDPAAGALAMLGQRERESLLEAALATLEPLEQEAVYLRYVEGMPQERITELLKLEEKTGARAVLQRCRRKLKRELERRLELMGLGSSFIREVSSP